MSMANRTKDLVLILYADSPAASTGTRNAWKASGCTTRITTAGRACPPEIDTTTGPSDGAGSESWLQVASIGSTTVTPAPSLGPVVVSTIPLLKFDRACVES
eukprot:CAMPEP_0175982512 /NCGR_PEP_ID=MMETSP0108-20121206/47949_1 /TAXON_ID=195067 ORGANISM="Goniomonas pacifica, Strain CCMP1869" /NCGR_SAMPLE_ID=MMETSP0108 /ASSEMBLY_ACC=CAM_ASM_000204 /LENGTH=101 /DNA_ID=CAMNT_0017313195 /DNA_START=114 /DNA_END=419 /DNA_ORIENTATION=+